jgi:hypothetical protein
MDPHPAKQPQVIEASQWPSLERWRRPSTQAKTDADLEVRSDGLIAQEIERRPSSSTFECRLHSFVGRVIVGPEYRRTGSFQCRHIAVVEFCVCRRPMPMTGTTEESGREFDFPPGL